jgi:hypothetical protein
MAKPHEPGPGTQERVWAGLRAAHANRQPRGRRARWLRVGFASTILLVAGLFVSAAMAQWPAWLARAIRPAAPANRAQSPSQQVAPPAPTPSPAIPDPPTAAPPTPEARGAAGGSRKLATPEESQLLLDAMRAIRVEHAPSRARTMLAGYLAHHPQGALAEEALVMLVEAAASHGDPDAPALARRYLAQYPNGEFTDQIRRAMREPATPSR